jgi:two-component system heavy metal sensor histidine kinase CusS
LKKSRTYPFYTSLRFRFGLLFNLLLSALLLGLIVLLYRSTRQELQQNFELRLNAGVAAVLAKTGINPLAVPLPQSGEYYRITYNNTVRTDTLFSNLDTLPLSVPGRYGSVSRTVTPETGGIIQVVYALPATAYTTAVQRLRVLLLLYVPAAILLAFAAGYLLSGLLLKPLRSVIRKANSMDLSSDIQLLEVPAVKDEQHELTDALNRMLVRIRKQAQQQNAFFASASHELRTPLSNMLAELQTLDTTGLPENLRLLVQHQVAEVRRLKELVNDFLLMSQLKEGRASAHRVRLDLADLCLDVLAGYEGQARDQALSFRVVFSPEQGVFKAEGDGNHLQVMWKNLVENAVKYSRPGTVVEIGLRREEGTVRLSVQNETDTPVPVQDNLKELFSRADELREGFGLGLWLVNELAQLNGGTLELTGTEKTFIAALHFPVADASQANRA